MNDHGDHRISGHAEVLTKVPAYSVLKDVVIEKHHDDERIDE